MRLASAASSANRSICGDMTVPDHPIERQHEIISYKVLSKAGCDGVEESSVAEGQDPGRNQLMATLRTQNFDIRAWDVQKGLHSVLKDAKQLDGGHPLVCFSYFSDQNALSTKKNPDCIKKTPALLLQIACTSKT